MYSNKPFWFKTLFILILVLLVGKADGQELPYKGLGSQCNGPGFSVSRLGEYISLQQSVAEKVVKAGCQLLPDSVFKVIGFSTSELMDYSKRETWINAPAGFGVKVNSMYAIFNSYRDQLLIGVDTTAPVISNQAASPLTKSVVITWSTSEIASSQVEYGKTNSYGASSPVKLSLVSSHTVSLAELTPGTEYHYRIITKDFSDNSAVGPDSIFTTTIDLTPIPIPEVNIGFVDGAAPFGVIDGVNRAFTLFYEPNPITSVKVYRNGIRLRLGTDYNLNKNAIEFLKKSTPQLGDLILIDYRY